MCVCKIPESNYLDERKTTTMRGNRKREREREKRNESGIMLMK